MDRIFPFAETKKAMAYLEANGKLVLTIARGSRVIVLENDQPRRC